MIILHYDEFGSYLTTEDIRDYITSLFSEGITTEEEILDMCIETFGNMHLSMIENALYGD